MMSTRERKSKANTESPTPNSVASDSAPSTPTTSSTGKYSAALKLKRGRGRPPLFPATTAEGGENVDQSTAEETPDDISDEVPIEKPEKRIISPVKLVAPSPSRRRASPVKRSIGTRTTSLNALKKPLMSRRSLSGIRKRSGMETRRNSTGKLDLLAKAIKSELANSDKRAVTRRAGRPRKAAEVHTPEPQKRRRRMNSTDKVVPPPVMAVKQEPDEEPEEESEAQEQEQEEEIVEDEEEIEEEAEEEIVVDDEEEDEEIIKDNEELVEETVVEVGDQKHEATASDLETIVDQPRAESVSKYSDTTDNSSFFDVPILKEEVDASLSEEPEKSVIPVALPKLEPPALDDEIKPPERVKSLHSTSNDSAIGDSDSSQSSVSKLDGKNVRRSTRQRKSTVRGERDDRVAVSPSKQKQSNEIKIEPGIVAAPLRVEVELDAPASRHPKSKIIITEEAETETEIEALADDKIDPSLSPEMISEGVSEISVKQFYGEPAFRENNLGIEEDPKLGEIVQVHEKINKEKEEDDVILTAPEVETEELVEELVEDGDGEEELIATGEEGVNVNVNGAGMEIEEDSSQIADETNTGDEFFDAKDIMDSSVVVVENDESQSMEVSQEDTLERETDTEENSVSESRDVEKCVDSKSNIVESDVSNLNNNDETVVGEKDIPELIINSNSNSNSNSTVTEEVSGDTLLEKCYAVDDEDENRNDNDVDDDDDEPALVMDEDAIIVSVVPNAVPALASASESISSLEPETVDLKPNETLETIKQKESHLKSLGLLTHKAAVEAKIEKQRRRELLTTVPKGKTVASTTAKATSGSGSVAVLSATPAPTSVNAVKMLVGQQLPGQEYTGTLKTVIKLHRPNAGEKRKTRLPLKMTFQKGRGKAAMEKISVSATSGGISSGTGSEYAMVNTNSDEETYYTIQNETDTQSNDSSTHGGHNRKHNRSHFTITSITEELNEIPDNSAAPSNSDISTIDPATEVAKSLVIPEKASSFSIHPDRLCQDQCFYCGGRFGLFDTPCHVAQIKSVDRQRRILENEEKLTVDNCLCDACYRHVDRRANCPSYKNKRISSHMHEGNNLPKSVSVVDQNELVESKNVVATRGGNDGSKPPSHCYVVNCNEIASHALRRKWIVKMRKSLNKIIKLNIDTSNIIGHMGMAPICDKHYDMISHLMVCALCKRKLPRNHIFYINQEIPRLEQLLAKQGIPVALGSIPSVCKLCRYFTGLVLKPPEGKNSKATFVKNYRRRLLQFHNVEIKEDSETDSPPAPIEVNAPARRGRIGRGGSRGRSRKSPDVAASSSHHRQVTIEHSVLSADFSFGETDDRPPSTSPPAGQIMLDNDVMVDYDLPMIDHSTPLHSHSSSIGSVVKSKPSLSVSVATKQQLQKGADMARVLRDNPNISMRELFPGEEEMGIHVSIPLGTNAPRTPEGWTKVNTTLQYDDATRHLWEELQKPYGNQSSFLRHLILLEKYFRNGDLVLSSNASYNASSYSESVQHRLRAYDNHPTPTAVMLQQQMNSSAPATVMSRVNSAVNSNYTKNNNCAGVSDQALRKRRSSPTDRSVSHRNNTNTTYPQPKKIIKVEACDDRTTTSPKKNHHSNTVPPELISINTKVQQQQQQQQQQQHVTQQQSASLLAKKSISPSTSGQHNLKSLASSSGAAGCSSSSSTAGGGGIIKLPDTLSVNERKQTNGKPWRPTLIPITSGGQPIRNAQLYQTADGRRLPALVQVMSGGRPYHISIHDYNRMCILRREKLMQIQHQQQLQKSGSGGGGGGGSGSVSGGSVAPSTVGSSGGQVASTSMASGTSCLSIPASLAMATSLAPGNRLLQTDTAAAMMKKIPIMNQQISLVQLHHHQKMPVTLSAEAMRKMNIPRSQMSAIMKAHIPIAPKPSQLPNSTTVVPMTSALIAVPSPSCSASTATYSSSSTSSSLLSTTIAHPSIAAVLSLAPTESLLKTGAAGVNWQWPNIEQQQHAINGAAATAAMLSMSGRGATLCSASDAATVSLLSKIPKSLTVIPQQKGRSDSRVPSSEEQQTGL